MAATLNAGANRSPTLAHGEGQVPALPVGSDWQDRQPNPQVTFQLARDNRRRATTRQTGTNDRTTPATHRANFEVLARFP